MWQSDALTEFVEAAQQLLTRSMNLFLLLSRCLCFGQDAFVVWPVQDFKPSEGMVHDRCNNICQAPFTFVGSSCSGGMQMLRA